MELFRSFLSDFLELRRSGTSQCVPHSGERGCVLALPSPDNRAYFSFLFRPPRGDVQTSDGSAEPDSPSEGRLVCSWVRVHDPHRADSRTGHRWAVTRRARSGTHRWCGVPTPLR
ncbi:hypothetical protein NDU88_002307 [Pleurodeles waltl]|uniref:Uncharacterized protein n=1 Tax=Pleurodeles waltl TaxID=8319 RepID=A0AAV7LC41_PLEWA|nr:hypothetical protein NDU88_002307 [Pleurodeles waltl]